MAREQFADLDFKGASRVLNLPAPASPDEPARLADLNSAVEGLSWKDSVVVATQGNISVASPGATIDGVGMGTSDRVLLKAQTGGIENGLYIWNGATVAMTRSEDANTSVELEQAVVTVEEGTDQGNTYRQTAVNFALDTDPVNWASFGTGAPAASETTAGIAEIATQAETDAGVDDARMLTPAKLAAWSGRVLRFQATFGDGAATQFDLVHNFGTRDVTVEVYRVASPYDTVICDVSRLGTNTVRLNFTTAPTTNQFRAVVIG